MTATSAAELVLAYPEERIRAKLEAFDWLIQKKDKRVSKNPAGYLAESIRKDYTPPRGFESMAERQQRLAVQEGHARRSRKPNVKRLKNNTHGKKPNRLGSGRSGKPAARGTGTDPCGGTALASPWFSHQAIQTLREGSPTLRTLPQDDPRRAHLQARGPDRKSLSRPRRSGSDPSQAERPPNGGLRDVTHCGHEAWQKNAPCKRERPATEQGCGSSHGALDRLRLVRRPVGAYLDDILAQVRARSAPRRSDLGPVPPWSPRRPGNGRHQATGGPDLWK